MCPVCNEPMLSFEFEGIEIDQCPRCRGTWLDTGELQLLAEAASVPPGPLSKALASRKGEKRGNRRCVRCDARLRVVPVNGVELDRCPRGCGLWFDAGEVPKLVASFAEGEAGAVARHFGNLFKSTLKPEA